MTPAGALPPPPNPATSSMLSRGGFASVCLALRLTEATNGAAVRIAPFSNFERPRRSYQT